MATAWDAVQFIFDLLDFLAHWRFWVCFLPGLLAALEIQRRSADPDIGLAVAIAVGAIGFLAGLIWEWTSD